MAAKRQLWRVDLPLLLATLLLLSIGLMVLFAINFKDARLAQDFKPSQQLIHAGIGLALMTLLARADYRLWQKYAKHWYGLGLVLLVAVMIFGTTAQGATRAINLGIIQFQPAELMKLGVIFMLAWFFNKYHGQLHRPQYLLAALGLVALPAVLVAIQPDLGSAIVIGIVWLGMILVSSAKKWHLALLIAGGLVLVPVLVSNLHGYQRQRIETFLNPTADPQGAGYNVLQSTIAVGSGRLVGKGLGSGTQSQLNFLPSQHTDFVFAVSAEKLGFVGASLIIILFGVVLFQAFLIALRAQDRFGQALAVGIGTLFFVHVVINIGMNLGIMPVTGIPLPLISYGGSNLIVSLMALGLLQSVRLHQADLEFKT